MKNHLVAFLTEKDGLDKAKEIKQVSGLLNDTNSMETVIKYNEIDHQRVCRILSLPWSGVRCRKI
jgi:hypothetical protein